MREGNQACTRTSLRRRAGGGPEGRGCWDDHEEESPGGSCERRGHAAGGGWAAGQETVTRMANASARDQIEDYTRTRLRGCTRLVNSNPSALSARILGALWSCI